MYIWMWFIMYQKRIQITHLQNPDGLLILLIKYISNK